MEPQTRASARRPRMRGRTAVSEKVDVDHNRCLAHARSESKKATVFERILGRMRALVREERYVVTTHAQAAIEEDELTIFDVERCFVTGKIIERQWDGERGEWKYLVNGKATDHTDVVAVAKIGPTRRLVIVTVYRVNGEAH
jgi:hypothetical protein